MKTQQVCKDFLRMQHGARLDAITATRLIQEKWGITVDWHEMSYALNYLLACQEAERTGATYDRMIEYVIK